MTNQTLKSKWHEIKKKTEAESLNAPVDTASKIKKLYLDTQLGSPVDTLEEADAQRNNFGPKDTQLETSENDELDHLNRPTLG
ncbi:hypothetical protein EP47_01395 [Legionella norrlandica]|uniref:Uncharacterized protein n=1 Tax=Legionella norrlandica TaxID=1498499 RepID=A0A0A2SRB4_9GAMM|nr:hypothetical protein [Legionella norrlandica]KGP62261.1 hypothetical protein EP47_01395 [Legionella norrlandica]